MSSLDGLLGRGLVTADEDGCLRLSYQAALFATTHRSRGRCWCAACVAQREKDRKAALGSYLKILLAEPQPDLLEIIAVRQELAATRPRKRRAKQPWEVARKPHVCSQIEGERPAA